MSGAGGTTRGWRSIEGTPLPLGATWIEAEAAYNFALYSKHAESVTLLLYRHEDVVVPAYEFELDHRHQKSGRVWHFRIARETVPDAVFYAYRVYGPRLADCIASGLPPSEWHNFDRSKVRFDPYARDLHFPQGYDARAASIPGISNAGRAPLGVLPSPDAAIPSQQAVALDADPACRVVYELHVRGFTRAEGSGVTPSRRGTFAGLVEKIPYLKELGVTAVELMPVFAFDEAEPNYWGYMPLSYFAVHRPYAEDRSPLGPIREFKAMVDRFHAAGIEVILDVVYNHTGEGDHRGPSLSYKGIDNTTYYLMSNNPTTPYANFSGTGNTLRCSNGTVRQLIRDSLRYWAISVGVDGFRFDEASIFTRRSDGSIDLDDPPIFGDLGGDPALARLCLIAEPWDPGEPGEPREHDRYQLGREFPGVGWLQWNDRFRNDVRGFVKSDAGLVGTLMRRLYGSDELFPDDRAHSYRPFQSVNYVASHDGLTLNDVVSYTNAPENSWGSGHEGVDDVPEEVLRLRKRQVKNFACLLMLASGTPMIRAGDEFMQSQRGMANPYDVDSPLTWLDWSRLDENRDVFRFFQKMIAFRRSHPPLAPARFWRERVRWYGASGACDLGSRELAFALSADGAPSIYVMVNAGWEARTFSIQEGAGWRRFVDTALPPPDDISESGAGPSVETDDYRVGERSIVVLVRDAD